MQYLIVLASGLYPGIQIGSKGVFKVLHTKHCNTDGVEEDVTILVVNVAASLPHSKPTEARADDVVTFGGYRKTQVNNYPPNRKVLRKRRTKRFCVVIGHHHLRCGIVHERLS